MYLLNISVMKCIYQLIVNGLNVSIQNPYLLLSIRSIVRYLLNISAISPFQPHEAQVQPHAAQVHTHQQSHAIS
jgi:hypothetical protein